jgi:hypothetical protein
LWAEGDEGFYEFAALNGVLAGLQLAGRSRTSGPAA